MWNDISEFFGFLLAVFILVVIVCAFSGLLMIPVDVWQRYQCNNFQEITQKKTKYIIFDACYVETKTGWQRYDEYKARAIASEGLSEEIEQ